MSYYDHIHTFGDLSPRVCEYEAGKLSREEEIKLMQDIIDTVSLDELPIYYYNLARDMISKELIKLKGKA